MSNPQTTSTNPRDADTHSANLSKHMKADVSAAFAGSHLGRHNDVDQDSTAFLHDTEDLSVGMSATTFQESKRKEERKAERTIRKLEIMLSEVTLGGAEHGVDVRDFAVVGK